MWFLCQDLSLVFVKQEDRGKNFWEALMGDPAERKRARTAHQVILVWFCLPHLMILHFFFSIMNFWMEDRFSFLLRFCLYVQSTPDLCLRNMFVRVSCWESKVICYKVSLQQNVTDTLLLWKVNNWWSMGMSKRKEFNLLWNFETRWLRMCHFHYIFMC